MGPGRRARWLCKPVGGCQGDRGSKASLPGAQGRGASGPVGKWREQQGEAAEWQSAARGETSLPHALGRQPRGLRVTLGPPAGGQTGGESSRTEGPQERLLG